MRAVDAAMRVSDTGYGFDFCRIDASIEASNSCALIPLDAPTPPSHASMNASIAADIEGCTRGAEESPHVCTRLVGT